MFTIQSRHPPLASRLMLLALGISLPLASAPAYATANEPQAVPAKRPAKAFRLADVVIDQKSTTPAPAATTVAPAPVAAAPVAPTSPQRVVHAEAKSNSNYMATVAWSAVMGAVLGAVVGTSIYYLADGQRPRNIAYWAAGGVLLGAGVGVVQVMVQESRTSDALSSRAPRDPAPTFRLALYQRAF